MQLELIPYSPGIGGWYAEFYPGPYLLGRCWSEKSAYMDGDAFEAVCFLVGHFNLYGPETLSGSRLQRCIDDLKEGARKVSRTESPKEIWDYSPNYGYCQFLEIDDWRAGRRHFSQMLRDLEVWMRGVQAQNQPVTCLGL